MYRANQPKNLSEAQRGEIIGLTRAGHSQAQIANLVGCSRSTVQRWQNRFSEEENVKRKRGTGLKKKTTLQQDNAIVRFASANPIVKASVIAG